MASKNAISLSDDNHKSLKKESTRRGVAMSVVLNEIVSNVFQDGIKPVVLQVPKELIKKNKEALSVWLNDKSAKLLKHWYPNK